MQPVGTSQIIQNYNLQPDCNYTIKIVRGCLAIRRLDYETRNKNKLLNWEQLEPDEVVSAINILLEEIKKTGVNLKFKSSVLKNIPIYLVKCENIDTIILFHELLYEHFINIVELFRNNLSVPELSHDDIRDQIIYFSKSDYDVDKNTPDEDLPGIRIEFLMHLKKINILFTELPALLDNLNLDYDELNLFYDLSNTTIRSVMGGRLSEGVIRNLFNKLFKPGFMHRSLNYEEKFAQFKTYRHFVKFIFSMIDLNIQQKWDQGNGGGIGRQIYLDFCEKAPSHPNSIEELEGILNPIITKELFRELKEVNLPFSISNAAAKRLNAPTSYEILKDVKRTFVHLCGMNVPGNPFFQPGMKEILPLIFSNYLLVSKTSSNCPEFQPSYDKIREVKSLFIKLGGMKVPGNPFAEAGMKYVLPNIIGKYLDLLSNQL